MCTVYCVLTFSYFIRTKYSYKISSALVQLPSSVQLQMSTQIKQILKEHLPGKHSVLRSLSYVTCKNISCANCSSYVLRMCGSTAQSTVRKPQVQSSVSRFPVRIVSRLKTHHSHPGIYISVLYFSETEKRRTCF